MDALGWTGSVRRMPWAEQAVLDGCPFSIRLTLGWTGRADEGLLGPVFSTWKDSTLQSPPSPDGPEHHQRTLKEIHT